MGLGKITSALLIITAIVSFGLAASAQVLFSPVTNFRATEKGEWGFGLPVPVEGTPTGTGSLAVGTVTPNPSFMLPYNAVSGSFSGKFVLNQPTSYPFYTSYTSVMVGIESGTFSQGGGPGSAAWCPGYFNATGCPNTTTANAGTEPGLIRVTGSGFGGTARLLGTVFARLVIRFGPGFLTGTLVMPGGAIGAATGVTAMGYGTLYHTVQRFTTMSSITTTGMPWTTGAIVATQSAGIVTTVQTTSGYDNRNAAGTTGTIRLVTATLRHFNATGANDEITQKHALTLQFLPEPDSTLSLVAGLISLSGLYGLQRRRMRRR